MPVKSIFLLLAMAALLGAGEISGREALLGRWREVAQENTIWTLESKGELLHISRVEDGKTTLEAACRTDGQECAGTDSGKKIKISMYFNGEALVEWETKDNEVTVSKFSEDGTADRLNIEVKPVSGSGKEHIIKLVRDREASLVR